jgi:hypothetical protein
MSSTDEIARHRQAFLKDLKICLNYISKYIMKDINEKQAKGENSSYRQIDVDALTKLYATYFDNFGYIVERPKYNRYGVEIQKYEVMFKKEKITNDDGSGERQFPHHLVKIDPYVCICSINGDMRKSNEVYGDERDLIKEAMSMNQDILYEVLRIIS